MSDLGINGVDGIWIETGDGSMFGLSPQGSGAAAACTVAVDGWQLSVGSQPTDNTRQSYLYAETADGLRGVDTGASYSLGSVSYTPAPHTVNLTIKAEGGAGLTQANWLLSSLSQKNTVSTLYVHTQTIGARDLNRTAVGDDHSTGTYTDVFYRTYTQHVGLVSADVTRGVMVSEIKMTLVLLDGVWLDQKLADNTFSFTAGNNVSLQMDDWSTAGAAYVLPCIRMPGPIAFGTHIVWGPKSWYLSIWPKGAGNVVESGDTLVIDVPNKRVYAENAHTNLLRYVDYTSRIFDGIRGGFEHKVNASHAGTVRFYSYYRGIGY